MPVHCLRKLCLFAVVIDSGCSADGSDTTIVTTAITATNGNSTVGSTALLDEGSGVTELGGETSDGGGEVGAGYGGDEGSTSIVDANATGDSDTTDGDTNGDTGNSSDTGGGNEMCD